MPYISSDQAIQVAKNKKASEESLRPLLGVSNEVDLLLAKHPNSSSEMLDDICERQSFDEKITGAALAHPNISLEQVLNVGWEYPLALYKNPALPALMLAHKNLLGEFDGEAFENSFKKELPSFVVDWLLAQGKAEYQVTYVSAPKRAPEILEKFRESKHPKVVATLLDKDTNTYLAWAADLGFDLAVIKLLPAAEMRSHLDVLMSGVSAEAGSDQAQVQPSLSGFLRNAMIQVEGLYFKGGRVNFGEGNTFYEEFLRLIQDFLKSKSNFTKLVAKVVDYDLAEIKRFGNPGKKPLPNITKADYYAKSGLEKSFKRLLVVLASCCQKQPETGWKELGQALGGLVSGNPLPSADNRSTSEGNGLPLIPAVLMDPAGNFSVSSMFGNPALEQVVKGDQTFLDKFHGEEFERALGGEEIPEFVLNWVLERGDLQAQAAYLFGSPRSAAITQRFRTSKYPQIALQLLEVDELSYLAWANDLGFVLPAQEVGEELSSRQAVDNWIEKLGSQNSDRWKAWVPSSGSAPTLQGEVIRALGRIESEFFRNGMMNWGDGSNHYEDFTKLIHTTLKAEKSFSKLVLKIVDADIAAIIRSGEIGKAIAADKKPREDAFCSNFFIKTAVEASHQRLGALISLWCERNPEPLPVTALANK